MQAFADFAKHVLINPRAVAVRTGHPLRLSEEQRTKTVPSVLIELAIAAQNVRLCGILLPAGVGDISQFTRRPQVARASASSYGLYGSWKRRVKTGISDQALLKAAGWVP
jgi:hypothetical protein